MMSQKFPIFDHEHSPQNIAAYAFLLGSGFGAGVLIFLLSDLIQGFGVLLSALCVFHIMEYIPTAMYRRKELTLSSFLLNHSREYHLAMTASVIEYFIELYFFPQMKTMSIFILFGSTIVFIGQLIRTLGVITAGSNFSHVIAEYKEKEHILIRHGVYRYFRHPSYTGFFYWAIGLQIALWNPICLVGYTWALATFFSERIKYEEALLVEFFGEEYKSYRKSSYTFLPLKSI